MCHFIFIGVPATVDEQIIDSLAKSHRRRLKPSWLPVSARELPGEVFYCTASQCDCGTWIGSRRRERDSEQDRIPKKIKVWRKKKWSEAKIARAIAAMTADDLHKKQSEPEGDTRDWYEFLRALLTRTGSDHVSLVLHWCSNEHELNVPAIERLRLSQTSPDDLEEWSEDVLYVCKS